MTARRDTLTFDPAPPAASRGGLRRLGPIGIAVAVGTALATLGVGFLVVSAATGGTSTQALPVSSATPTGSVVASASPTPSASVLAPAVGTSAGDGQGDGGHGKVRAGELESQLVGLINQARSQAGCRDVRSNSKLHGIARNHSSDMARHNFLSHQGSNGTSYAERAHQAGYDHPLGEAIARGPRTASDVLQQWLGGDSRSTVLDCAAVAVGVGVATARDGTVYWTADFGA